MLLHADAAVELTKLTCRASDARAPGAVWQKAMLRCPAGCVALNCVGQQYLLAPTVLSLGGTDCSPMLLGACK